ncbi:FAD-dependent monooxygenase [Goodfellowiella coeruleoviolacea]|uniref:2-polyprenyl-6-methoxyphenol hydroxylase n=1 Tax=Goodfellowiella coeruleoviolacea TaxID=334858 RepID=A0AAE3GLN0_9PSEU|nr:FAD-dependent monooxygenase [Goodfellowiella coeruleoviolacea]MCP2169878.1 2-polyprenyl-6-methoxyphenol hydroxylase [Goodfellowiella coeruleoviolacea]
MRKAIVVGGGVGGLAAAVALHRQGWRIEVLERAPAFTEVGAGLALQPNALRALDALGLGAAVRERALTDPPLGIRDQTGRWLIRNDLAGLRRRYGQWALIHRADLLDLLLAALPAEALRPGVEVRQVGADGTVVHTQGTATADLVVAADGLHSVTRRSLWPQAPGPRYAGYVTWRFIAPPRPVEGSVESWGRGERFGYAPLPDGRVYCYVMANAPRGAGGGLAELRRRFAGWHNPIPALLDAVAAEHAGPGQHPDEHAVLRHDTHELPDLDSYVSGRVALLGDAAHAMTPNLGQGAGQALEDAVVLGKAVASADVTAALAAYDRSRRPRTQRVVRRSHQLGVLAHQESAVLGTARNTALRMTPPSVYTRSLGSVLSWTA